MLRTTVDLVNSLIFVLSSGYKVFWQVHALYSSGPFIQSIHLSLCSLRDKV
jgi:hypothetical protein